jgi:hypothetical protein
MGLEDVARHHTSETGTALVDEDGRAYAAWPTGTEDDRSVSSPTAELEILRGQLARLLYEHSAGSAEYLFGDQSWRCTTTAVVCRRGDDRRSRRVGRIENGEIPG